MTSPVSDQSARLAAKSFADRVVMVVGAAGGIGASCASGFSEAGARVVATDVDDSVQDIARELGVLSAGGFATQCDLTSEASINDALEQVMVKYGVIDHLVVTAGVLQDATPIDELTLTEWSRVLSVNLTGPFLVSRAVLPQMKEARSGSIVNIASWWGRGGHPFFSAYCASKAGLIVFTQSLAAEASQFGIRANTICPGNINTSMHRDALRGEAEERGISFEEMKDLEWAKIPLGVAGEPSVIADAAIFLCSEAASYITGASLDVNGGVLFH